MNILQYFSVVMLSVAIIGGFIAIYDLTTNFSFSYWLRRKFGKK